MQIDGIFAELIMINPVFSSAKSWRFPVFMEK